MDYLMCEKCGGHYKLKEGESPDDFVSCECGGKLKYVQNFNMHFDDELDPINEFTICPNCGKEILSGEKFCKSCKDESEDTKKVDSNSKRVKKHFESKKLIIIIIGIIVGILIVLIPTLLLVNQNYVLLLLIIGGLLASLIAGRNNEERTLIGVSVGFIAGLIILIFRSNIEYSSESSIIGFFIFEMIGPIFVLTIFGLIGGLIDISVRYIYNWIGIH
ncbi:MAG: hypothetical protein ACXVHV_05700, partial [Methanobacterium sp.]